MTPIQADWSGIKTLALSGATLEEIAQSTGISLNTIKSRSAREQWFEPIRAAKQITEKRIANQIANGQMQPDATDASKALADILSDDARETKIQASKFARTAITHAATLQGKESLSVSRHVKDAVGVAATIHGWGSDTGNASQINLLCQNVGNLHITGSE